MSKFTKKNNALICMIRGKIIENTIRFYFQNIKNDFPISCAQNYANDIYYLYTRKFPAKMISSNSQPINALIRVGIKAFKALAVRKLINTKSYRITLSKKQKTIFPDFKVTKLNINNKNIKNCCLELKVANRVKPSLLKKHATQCTRYSIKSRKPVILLYLIYRKIGKKHPIFAVKPEFYIVNKNI